MEGEKRKKVERKAREPREEVVDDWVPPVDKDGKLKNMDKPDVDGKENKVKELTGKIDELLAKRDKINQQQQAGRGGNDPESQRRREILSTLKKLREERGKVLNEAKALKEKIDRIKKPEEERKKAEGKLKGELKTDSIDKLTAKIAALERQQERTAMSKNEEAMLIKEMQQLRTKRAKEQSALSSVQEKLDSLDKDRKNASSSIQSLPELQAQVSAKYDAATQLRNQIEPLDKEFKALESANEGKADKAKKLQAERDELQKQIDSLFSEREEVKRQFNLQWSRFKKFMDALNKQRDAERKEWAEKRAKENEERERLEEEEEMKKKPWEAEIALCDVLTSYFNNVINSRGAQSSAATDKPKEAPVALRAGGDSSAFQGLKAVGNDDEEDYLKMGQDKKKKKQPAKKQTGKLVIPVDLIQSFGLLSLVPPGKIEDVPNTLTALAEKRAYYDVLPRAPRKKKAAAGENAPAEQASAAQPPAAPRQEQQQKKSKPPGLQSDELFPTIPGSRSPKAAPASPSGPSAVDRIKASGSQ